MASFRPCHTGGHFSMALSKSKVDHLWGPLDVQTWLFWVNTWKLLFLALRSYLNYREVQENFLTHDCGFFLLLALSHWWRNSTSISVSSSLKWDAYPFIIGWGEGENKEASKDPAALGEGILAPGLLSGHQGYRGIEWPLGLVANLLKDFMLSLIEACPVSPEGSCFLPEGPVAARMKPVEKCQSGSPSWKDGSHSCRTLSQSDKSWGRNF